MYFFLKNRIFAWEASKSFPIKSELFAWVIYSPFPIFVEKCCQFKVVKRFIIALYDWVNTHENVNEAWWEMFCKKSWNFENIPLKQHAVHLHVMKAFLVVRQKQDMARLRLYCLWYQWDTYKYWNTIFCIVTFLSRPQSSWKHLCIS